MLGTVIVILLILWFLGYVRIDAIAIPDIPLFAINGQTITLWNILILMVIMWAIGILPSPIREISGVLLVLWILSVLGFIAVTGLANILVIAIIVGLIAALLGGF